MYVFVCDCGEKVKRWNNDYLKFLKAGGMKSEFNRFGRLLDKDVRYDMLTKHFQ